MNPLTRQVLDRHASAIPTPFSGAEYPERILQFGEGNFLRAFVDWMVQRLNAAGRVQGRVVVVQPLAQGLVETLNAQDGLYTLLLRGVQEARVVEQREVITAISRGLNPYADWSAFLATARQPELRFVVSNTTEAGIAYVAEPFPAHTCPASFPAKLTAWLYARYQHFHGSPEAGVVLLPCELIDRNGDVLKRCVLQQATVWGRGDGFRTWLETQCTFCTTLVDRIVTGYPREEAAALATELGYEDKLLVAGEIFHLWVIEGPQALQEELPFAQAGLNVLWTSNLEPYRTRKVRILNGAHTMTVLAAYLAGRETVRDCVNDPLLSAYLRQGIFEEIIPTLDLSADEKQQFAEAVLERFANPFIHHQLLSIALNSVSKFAVRVLPSLLAYRERRGVVPPTLTFSLAALLAFYRGEAQPDGMLQGMRDGCRYPIKDDPAVLQAFIAAWSRNSPAEVCHGILTRTDWWGQDLSAVPGLAEAVTVHLQRIVREGMTAALQAVVVPEVRA